MTVKKIEEGGGSEETNVAGKIEVDGKEYSAEDVQNLIKQGTTATQKTQEVAGILAAAEKYGVDIDTYLSQAEGAFGVMSQLITDKVIDEKGNIVKKKTEEPAPKKDEEEVDLDKLFNLSGEEKTKVTGAEKIAGIVAKALGPQLESMKKLGEKVAAVDKTQGDMIRLNLEDKIVGKFPNLKPNDVSQVFASAMQDRSKSLWEHAETFSKAKASDMSVLRAEHAKEFGVNLEKFDENKLKEQEAGGGAGVFFKGKKFSFNAKPGDKDAVSPAKAAAEYIESIASKD